MLYDLDEIDAVATIHFGLQYGAGRKLTPRQFSKLRKQRELKSQAEESRFALIACVIANVNRPKNKKAFRVTDFMTKKPPMSDREMEQAFAKLKLHQEAFTRGK